MIAGLLRSPLIQTLGVILILRIFFTLLALSISGSVSAAGDASRPEAYASSEKNLHHALDSVLVKLSKNDKSNLNQAQKIWLNMRDLDCKWAENEWDCLIDRTKRRTVELLATPLKKENLNLPLTDTLKRAP